MTLARMSLLAFTLLCIALTGGLLSTKTLRYREAAGGIVSIVCGTSTLAIVDSSHYLVAIAFVMFVLAMAWGALGVRHAHDFLRFIRSVPVDPHPVLAGLSFAAMCAAGISASALVFVADAPKAITTIAVFVLVIFSVTAVVLLYIASLATVKYFESHKTNRHSRQNSQQ